MSGLAIRQSPTLKVVALSGLISLLSASHVGAVAFQLDGRKPHCATPTNRSTGYDHNTTNHR
jgi:hypothetical protein